MADIALAAFSIFFMGSPSFLGHQQALAEGHGRSNCETLFGMAAIPSDNYIRLMLDGVSPAAFDALFMQAIKAAGPLTRFQCLGGRLLIALDGTEHFCSRKIKCPQCSTRRRSEWRHGILPRLPRCQPGRTWPQASLAAAAGVHCAARRGREAGLRTQCRQALAGPAPCH